MSHKLPEQSGELNPEVPPPAYSTHTDNSGPSGQVQRPGSPQERIPGAYPHRVSSFFGANTTPSFTLPPPPHFGPTPLLHSDPTLGLLPYYDPRSPYAIAEAASRARWRFICASMWAIGIVMWLAAAGAYRGLRDI